MLFRSSPPPIDHFLPHLNYSPPWSSEYWASPQLELLHRWMQTTLVCHQWREVATSSPTMWSNIDIGPRNTPNKIVNILLCRSQSAPISFSSCYQVSNSEPYRVQPGSWDVVDFRPLLLPRLKAPSGKIAHANCSYVIIISTI